MARQHDRLTDLDRRRAQKRAAEHKQDWKDVEDIYQTLAQALLETGMQINSAINLINQVNSLPATRQSTTLNINELTITIKGLTSDINLFANDLAKIHGLHSSYSGLIKDEDELALCLSVFSDYTVLNDRYRAIIFAPMLTITEFLAEAAQIIADIKQPEDVVGDQA